MTDTTDKVGPNAWGGGPLGRPLSRVDGTQKVTGRATYAYEYQLAAKPAYGVMLGAAIARGRVRSIDTGDALQAPGVLHVMTHANAPGQGEFGPPRRANRFTRARACLDSDRIHHFDEPVALVLAETFEAARAAARLVRVAYAAEPGSFDLRASLHRAYAPETINVGMATDTSSGEPEAAFQNSAVRVDATYATGYQNHNAMEPHAALALWEGSRLTVFTSTQTVANTRGALAATLRIPPERVRVVSRFVGGGFGGKLGVRAETVLAALAARELGRPVKVAQTRQQTFSNVGHRPAMVQRVRLGAARDGQLASIAHEVAIQSTAREEFAEQTATPTRSLYAAPNRLTRHRLVDLDLQGGEPMRAPGEAPGLLALECAMDELAHVLGQDPIELRIRNEPDRDPVRQVPFSSRSLVACMREGAQRFGWAHRPREPASRREGRLLVGYGMAAAIRPNYLRPAEAAVRLERDGTVTARLDMTDIGTGSYTILTQIAAQSLGLPVEAVRIMLGDSDFPVTPGSGGSFGAASAGSALHHACEALKAKVKQQGGEGNLQTSAARLGPIEATGKIAPGQSYEAFSQHAFGAHFAEVTVDIDSAEMRLRRMLGVFAAGRILNPKTARSQMIGGMIWGLSAALLEESIVDPRNGQFVNHDLAEYHVPVHADVGEIDAVLLVEEDDKGNPLGIKGIGELGICGAGAAVANAVFNATGVRVRSFPITLDKILPGLPALET